MASDVDQQAWECRDKDDQARTGYNSPLRSTNRLLAEENMRLKKLLRENGIAWSPVAQAHLNSSRSTKRHTRSSMTSKDLGRPQFPMEIILKILKFALTSQYPIIDPLSFLTSANLTDKEKSRGNQVAIHFLATCKALRVEGLRIFWTSNDFVFTTPQAVRQFAELDSRYRTPITHVTFRVIAKYYDDNPNRKHSLESTYHHSMSRQSKLKVHVRPRETPLVRGGLRSYAWTQIVDFLHGLRAPYDPKMHHKEVPRPKLLPSLSSLRLDLVNFSDSLLPFSGSEFHDATSHEFGCSLNEIQITGMPAAASGLKAAAELSGLLKDEGLYLEGDAAFHAVCNRSLRSLPGEEWNLSRVVRAYDEDDEDIWSDLESQDDFFMHHNHTKIGIMPAAPPEHGHPKSTRHEDSVIWKRVPISRDSKVRDWVQFCRYGGQEVKDHQSTSDEDVYCPNCGEMHPASVLSDSDED
ncbi:unnamed protein product [Clonostachys rhizophaga]|uniref:Uncharacterized protein n=1 Tax=Clonostachys rhizophaga TaxID=160324 RepID=A0A9N9YU09_9HYPO|nr:unnamed protein product [Clonostachys rhizophaga]